MQDIIFYVAAGDTLGVCKDRFGNQTVALPSLIRGGEARFRMRLLLGDGTDTPLPIEPLQQCVSWEFVMDSDFNDETKLKIVADHANITVASVPENAEEEGGHTFTEVSIPIPETDTEEVREYLNTSETASLNGELAGYDADGKLTYILQLKGFTIRNRIAASGPPSEVADRYLPEAGVRALISSMQTGPMGPTVIADPVTEMAVADETWGDCRYLDAAFRQLSFRGRVRSLRRVSLETVSIDSGVTGNIVLVPIVNGSELPDTSFVVAVGAAPAVAEFALEVASGTLALRRDTDDERDTLKDSGNTPVTAVVLSVILEVQYDA